LHAWCDTKRCITADVDCCCSYEHRVLLACKSGGDAWLDRHLITKIFSRHGKVLDVFLPYGRKVPVLLLSLALSCLHFVPEGGCTLESNL
jgi:hypothetical protein